MDKIIVLNDKDYYYYDTYDSYEEALDTAKTYRENDKQNKSFILKVETGFIDPEIKYRLYMSKFQKIMW